MNANSVLIKICGVKTPELAEKAVIAGADYIGIIFHSDSKRFVDQSCAQAIALATQNNEAIPVAVFVNHSAEDMLDICQKTNIKTVQLHGATAKKQHRVLPNEYTRIYVQNVEYDGTIAPDANDGLQYCLIQRDFLLLDAKNPGSGKSFSWNNYHNPTRFRLGLAGGLTINNVELAIKIIKPQLVDISSGVENQQGEKDLSLIHDFIMRTKSIVEGNSND